MVEVFSRVELIEHLHQQLASFPFNPGEVEVLLYYLDAPDRRIGWTRTYLVTVRGQAVGFSDGPLTT